MAVTSRPEPIPVDVMAAPPDAAVVAAAELVVELVPDTAEVMLLPVPCHRYIGG